MSHVLTLKIPHPLLNRLERVAGREGRSKGSVVREAIERLLERKGDKDPGDLDIRAITEAHFKNRRLKIKVDWEELRRKASEGAPSISPEEEVRQSRWRRLL